MVQIDGSKGELKNTISSAVVLIHFAVKMLCYLLTIVHREYVYSVAVYQKYLTRLEELIIFEPRRENYHFSQPS